MGESQGTGENAAGSQTALRGEGNDGDSTKNRPDESSPESEVKILRRRWELASVLNFLNVFEVVIDDDLKLTAEEIEVGLVESNGTNARLHIALLKGIPPVVKSLDVSDAWITVMCKKLAPWWPWVAEGDIPLTASKGEEISKYQELDPADRLHMLKALCEIRIEQDDAVHYVNNIIKEGAEVSHFRKESIGGNGRGASYWFDGDDVLGYRLYKEQREAKPRTKARGDTSLAVPYSVNWETIATNLNEFYQVSAELSSSRILAIAATGKKIETDAIPILEKLHRKKERILKRKMKEQMLLCNSRNSTGAVRTVRSCRNRVPVSYTFDEYERAISEAVQITEEMVPLNEQRLKKKNEQEKKEPGRENEDNTSMGSGAESGVVEAAESDSDYYGKSDESSERHSDEKNGNMGSSEEKAETKNGNMGSSEEKVETNSELKKPEVSILSKTRRADSETRNMNTRSRMLSAVVLDSEVETST